MLELTLRDQSITYTMAPLKFAPWSSDIELSFYAALRSLKVVGRYEVRPNDAPDRSARMQMHGDAFTSDEYVVPVKTNGTAG